MERLRSKTPAPDAVRGLSLALGNFDGLHAGHRAVIAAARTAATSRKTGWALATFEPPPRAFFGRASEPYRLMLPDRRAEEVEMLGAAALFELPFDAVMASRTPEAFVRDVLGDQLGAVHVSVGADFRFGHKRAGDVAQLTELGRSEDIGVTAVAPVGGETKTSSSQIRACLTEGRPGEAARRLGRYWCAEGEVEHGEKRGRTIGYPTANLTLGPLIHPRDGIYTVLARIDGAGPWRAGIANFGRTPTTGERDPLLEVHLFDFEGDLYGAWMEVALIRFQRAEAKFDTLDALVTQMHADSAEARQALAARDCMPTATQLPAPY